MVAHTVKNLPAMWETQVQSLDQEDPLEKGITTHSCILDWRIPWTEDPEGYSSWRQRKIYYVNTKQKKSGIAILFSDTGGFQERNAIRDKKGHYTVVKGPILQEDRTILNVHMPNSRVSNT